MVHFIPWHRWAPWRFSRCNLQKQWESKAFCNRATEKYKQVYGFQKSIENQGKYRGGGRMVCDVHSCIRKSHRNLGTDPSNGPCRQAYSRLSVPRNEMHHFFQDLFGGIGYFLILKTQKNQPQIQKISRLLAPRKGGVATRRI